MDGAWTLDGARIPGPCVQPCLWLEAAGPFLFSPLGSGSQERQTLEPKKGVGEGTV